MREIPVSEFKAKALAIVEQVSHGEEITVTKRGKPIVRVVPVEQPAGLTGSVRFLVSDNELLDPIGGEWEAERP
jgi:prevent-host-death family protein